MRLIEPKRTVRVERPRTVHEISCEELAPEATEDQAAVSQVADGNGQSETEAAPEAQTGSGSPDRSVSGGDLPREA